MSARSHSRSAERHLLSPSVDASFGAIDVSIKDISISGARVKHDEPLEAGSKSVLRIRTEERPVSFEAMVVWTQKVAPQEESGQFVSGVKLFADQDSVGNVILGLGDGRSMRVEECRRSDRFILIRPVKGDLDSCGVVRLEDLSSRGARIETTRALPEGATATLRYSPPEQSFEVVLGVQVVWSHLKAIWSADEDRYQAGLEIVERHEMQRLAIGHLRETGLAIQDTRSLKLKLRLQPIKLRLAAMGRSETDRGALVEAIRLEFEENPNVASRWWEKAEKLGEDASLRGIAGPIARHTEALAVWEYLDRSMDPTLIAMAIGLS